MLFLLLAIVCSASLALLFRHSEGRQMNRLAITATNYLAAAGASLLEVVRGGAWPGSPAAFWAEAPAVLDGAAKFSAAAAPWWGVTVGLPTGVLFFFTFVLYQVSIRHNGPALSGMFGKLGVLVPTLLSIALFRQLPQPLQWLGIALALAAVVMSLKGSSGGGPEPARRALLPVLLLAMGLAEFSNKIFQGLAGQAHRGVFLLAVFGTAFVVSLLALLRQGDRPTRAELAVGLAVGIPNVLSSYFLILALQTVNAAVAFPAYSAGSTVLIALGARAIYGDRLGPWRWAAVGLTVVSLALMG